MTSLTYIYHDCFLYRTVGADGREIAVVFDYWQDAAGRLMELISECARIYVLVSHFHKDHYNPAIYEWSKLGERVHYIISRDTAKHGRHILKADSLYKGVKPSESQVSVLSKGESFEDDLLKVDAFGSTDAGNSYVVRIKRGDTIFHAGDLNFWAWRDESTAEEVESAKRGYLSELSPIIKNYPELDYAMFPVDSRIGSGYWEGAAMLLDCIRVARFFPMHFELADSDAELAARHRDALRFDLYGRGAGEFIGLTSPYSMYAVR